MPAITPSIEAVASDDMSGTRLLASETDADADMRRGFPSSRRCLRAKTQADGAADVAGTDDSDG
ncbi:hypothetical protein QYH69_20085 [Paraburkholderia sp. SARCC-3016]|uniref:hypothetical protein n=1 Tax=Paraburkholderia sp. SARCC-3016 TaxID=3058611 RepID=UPI00280922CA|nr:hypothetical protein [Paraburkholderia sp. SARCC-3016]MDQ7979550.1 hypothetical protein [Paraburkholderia sp. SARCC-3016]